MKTIILAAGRGSRMGRMTSNMPKCMVEIGGQNLLSWQLSAFKKSGLDNMGIVVGYRSECFEQADVEIIRNLNWSNTNMVSSLLCADNWIENEEFIISYADIFYSNNVISKLKESTGDIVITYDLNWLELWNTRFDEPLSDAESFKLDSNGKLIEIGESPDSLSDIEGQFMGLLKFSQKGWRLVKQVLNKISQDSINTMDMTSLLNLLLHNDISIDTVSINEGWGEIDSEQDLAVYEKLINEDSFLWMR